MENIEQVSDLPPVPDQAQFSRRDEVVADASPDNPVPIAPGVEVIDPRLGRLPEFDERSRQFPMRAAIEETGKRYKPRSYTWAVEATLNQGSQPSCVGHAWTHELLARPAVVEADGAYATWVYRTAQRYDEWQGEAYAGTSVLAGAKVLQQTPPKMSEGRGLLGEYRWIFGNLDDLIKTLGYFGPVVFGTNWYEGMFRPTPEGYVRLTGQVAGGHAYLLNAVDVDDRRFRIHNSWGASWGQGGGAWLTYDDAMRLLGERGECCVPVRRKQLA